MTRKTIGFPLKIKHNIMEDLEYKHQAFEIPDDSLDKNGLINLELQPCGEVALTLPEHDNHSTTVGWEDVVCMPRVALGRWT